MTGPFPKIAVPSLESEELRQLRAGDEQSDTAFEADKNAFRNKIDDHSGLGQPGEKSQHADYYRRARRQSPES